MYRLFCLLFLFLLQYSCANGLGRNRYRKPYNRYYRKGQGNYRKSPGTALANSPRCKKSSTWLSIVVLDKDGTAMANTIVFVGQPEIVSQVEKNNEGYVKTDKKGHVKVKVRGCDVGIVVWTNDENSKYRYVNLDKCTKDYWNVVIQIGKACNFLVYVDGSERILGALTRVKFQRQDLVYYLVDSDGGEESTSGSAVVGPDASPICINVKNEGSLKITLISQTSDIFSVMCLDRVEEGGQAAMALPFPLTLTLTDATGILSSIGQGLKWNLVVGSNVFVDQEPNVIPFYGYDSQGNRIATDGVVTYGWGYSDKPIKIRGAKYFWGWGFFCVKTRLTNVKRVVVVRLDVDKNKRSNLKGNVYITDRKGFTRTIKIPSEAYPFDGDSPGYWILGCIRGSGVKKFTEINKFVVQDLPGDEDDWEIDELENLCNDGTVPQGGDQ